jgi:hypothetical protein
LKRSGCKHEALKDFGAGFATLLRPVSRMLKKSASAKKVEVQAKVEIKRA